MSDVRMTRGERRPRKGLLWKSLLVLFVLAFSIAACSGENLPDPTTPEAPGTTAAEAPEAPEETTPPETTPPDTGAPPEEPAPEDTGDVPVWVWVVLGLLLIGLVAWIGARSGSKRDTPPPVVAPAQPDTATIARTAYADARWLYDQLTPGLAVWKGDSQYQIKTGSGTSMSDRNAVWAEADTRLKSARDALYNVESANPSAPVAGASRDLVTSLNSVREGVDRLAAARLATLSGEGSAESEAAATDDLAARRSALQGSLTQFSQHL